MRNTIIEKYTVRRERVEQVILVGPIAERKAVVEAIAAAGGRLLGSGRYTDAELWPNVDPNRFRIRAEFPVERI